MSASRMQGAPSSAWPYRALGAALLLALLGTWEWVARHAGLSALVLPAPSAIAASLWQGLGTGYFMPHLRATLAALLLGLAGGGPAGLAIGIALAESP
ncbi:ABC transporter permease, partial [Paracidovorax avenae]